MRIKIAILSCLSVFSVLCVLAREDDGHLLRGLELAAESQLSVSNEKTPLWLNANKYGLSSLDSDNGYLRLSALRPAEVDSLRQWRWGYGVDVALGAHYASTLIVQQAYAELSWKKLRWTLGAKEQPVMMKNQELSSGALTLGCNARPVPQARMDIDWFPIPGTKGWWAWKLHGSYGMTTDGRWIKSAITTDEHYTGNVLYHEKALYWRFGKTGAEGFPLTFTMALQMCTQFGGTTYNATGRGYEEATTLKHDASLKAFLNTLYAGGSDETDGSSQNVGGNHVGSWNFQLMWQERDWSLAARFERVFEDQSMMFIQYGVYDHLLGLDLMLPRNPYLSALTLEHLSTYDQSGAILHDASANIPDKMNGRDNYYNHSLYMGWQHWGQTIGNPLLTSPVNNDNGSLIFRNNRVRAWHLGLAGDPASWLHWRLLATFTRNLGLYDHPFEDPEQQQYYLLEVVARPCGWHGWQVGVGVGLDHGHVVGNNVGGQLTVRKTIKIGGRD